MCSTRYTGDRTRSGEKLREVKGHFNDKRKPNGFNTEQIFLSPSIRYAADESYAKSER